MRCRIRFDLLPDYLRWITDRAANRQVTGVTSPELAATTTRGNRPE